MRSTYFLGLIMLLLTLTFASSCRDRAYAAFLPEKTTLSSPIAVDSKCHASDLCCSADEVSKLYDDFVKGLKTVMKERRAVIYAFHGNLRRISTCYIYDNDHQQEMYGSAAKVSRAINDFLYDTMEDVVDFWNQLGLATICAACSNSPMLSFNGKYEPLEYNIEFKGAEVENALNLLYTKASTALKDAQRWMDTSSANKKAIIDINKMMESRCGISDAWYYKNDVFNYSKFNQVVPSGVCPGWFSNSNDCSYYSSGLLLAAGDWLPGYGQKTKSTTAHYRGVDDEHYAEFIRYCISRGRGGMSNSVYAPDMNEFASDMRNTNGYVKNTNAEIAERNIVFGMTAFMSHWGYQVSQQLDKNCLSFTQGEPISPYCLDWKVQNAGTDSKYAHMNSEMVERQTYLPIADISLQHAPAVDMSSSLSGGAIAGIVIGVLAAIVIFVCLAGYCMKKDKAPTYKPSSSITSTSTPAQGMPPSMSAPATQAPATGMPPAYGQTYGQQPAYGQTYDQQPAYGQAPPAYGQAYDTPAAYGQAPPPAYNPNGVY